MPYPTPRPPAPNGPARCPKCLAPVIWCTTAHQRAQMVDPDRNDRGNQAVRVDHTGRWLVRQLDKERPTPENDEHLHMPHIATCTAATPRPARTASAGGRGRRVLRPAPWQR